MAAEDREERKGILLPFFVGVVVIMITLLGTFYLVNQNVSSVSQSVSQRLDNTNQSVSQRLDNMSQSINQRFDTRFDAMNQNVAQGFNVVDQKLNSMNQRVNNMEKIVLNLNGEAGNLIKETDRLTGEIRSMKEQLIGGQTIKDELTKMAKTLDELRKWCNKTEQRLDDLEKGR